MPHRKYQQFDINLKTKRIVLLNSFVELYIYHHTL